VKLAVIVPEGAAVQAPPEETAPEETPPAEAPRQEAPPQEAPPAPATQEAAAEAEAPSSSEGVAPPPAQEPVSEPPPAPEPEPAAPVVPEPAPIEADGAGERTFVSPVVARIASEHGVDVNQISGSGRGGRVTKKDILAFVESGARAAPKAAAPPEAPPAPLEAPEPEPAPAPAAPEPPPTPAPPQPEPAMAQAQAELIPGETFEPVSAMRRGIAEHMRRSLDTSAHVTSAIEVDMSRVVEIRKKLKREYQEAYGVNPTYLSFIARATVETLREYPWINGELRGDQIVTRNYVNLGFAVELADGKGLIVPVVRHAEGLNLLGMARSVSEIAARARDKKLLPDDVQGGTFTITNPGGYGTFHGTPVISQPQAAILGTYAVVKRPWVVTDDRRQDVIAIRPIMNLTLTYDHRLVDGALAGRFLRDLRERLETWEESNY
jgi:2-oxoglutarate dehydrogenase E2 component (dihydrolipoamide succinyltransferase)